MSKEQWKSTGKELGNAFEGLAKTLIRSAATGAEKAEKWANNEEIDRTERTVFNDGTWRETGKTIGNAMSDLGKTIVGTGAEGVRKAEEWSEQNDKENKE